MNIYSFLVVQNHQSDILVPGSTKDISQWRIKPRGVVQSFIWSTVVRHVKSYMWNLTSQSCSYLCDDYPSVFDVKCDFTSSISSCYLTVFWFVMIIHDYPTVEPLLGKSGCSHSYTQRRVIGHWPSPCSKNGHEKNGHELSNRFTTLKTPFTIS